jgi:hypothetical protein
LLDLDKVLVRRQLSLLVEMVGGCKDGSYAPFDLILLEDLPLCVVPDDPFVDKAAYI